MNRNFTARYVIQAQIEIRRQRTSLSLRPVTHCPGGLLYKGFFISRILTLETATLWLLAPNARDCAFGSWIVTLHARPHPTRYPLPTSCLRPSPHYNTTTTNPITIHLHEGRAPTNPAMCGETMNSSGIAPSSPIIVSTIQVGITLY